MTKFKVGDRVRSTRLPYGGHNPPPPIGAIGTMCKGGYVQFDGNPGPFPNRKTWAIGEDGLEAVEPEPRFKIGDHVRTNYGREGTIVPKPADRTGLFPYYVKLPSDIVGFRESELSLVRPEPKFKAGDRVRVTHSHILGTVDTGQTITLTTSWYDDTANEWRWHFEGEGEGGWYSFGERVLEALPPEPKFEVGDWVRVESDTYAPQAKRGSIGQIIKNQGGCHYVQVNDCPSGLQKEGAWVWVFDDGELVKVPEPKFKVGDRVVGKTWQRGNNYASPGKVVRVIRHYPSNDHVTVCVRHDNGWGPLEDGTAAYGENQLRLIDTKRERLLARLTDAEAAVAAIRKEIENG
jgi:hypothetical protein